MPDIYAIGLVIVLALAFDFINGFHDTANAIATCIATRSLSPRIAIIMSAFLNFVGAMVSTGVAKTIGGEIVTSPQMVDSTVLIAALFAAIVWNLFTWKIGMPSSSLSCADRRCPRSGDNFLRYGGNQWERGFYDRGGTYRFACYCHVQRICHHDASVYPVPECGKIESELYFSPYTELIRRGNGIFPRFK